jgi:hypothetical protein
MKPEEIFAHWRLVRRGLMKVSDMFQEDELYFYLMRVPGLLVKSCFTSPMQSKVGFAMR